MSNSGRFVWRELVSTNPEKATAFYTGLFGWSSATVDMPTGPYTMFKSGDQDAGGMMAAPAPGIPSHWLDYITVDDVDATVKTATAAGATVIAEPVDIPVGRFAVLSDPAGAAFGVLKSATPEVSGADPDAKPKVGSFCWSQLMSKDLDAVTPFYARVFGWSSEPGPNGMVIFRRGETMVASAMALPKENPAPNHWLKYVLVEDADASTAKAEKLGAKTIAPLMTIEGMGRFSVLADPAGGIFSVWKNLGASAA